MPNNILIVDDQVELTKILGEYFRVKKGYNVLTATDGKVALNVIREQTPELVLLDMKLPSVNGLEILKILRKDYPGTKVIVMTAYDTEFKKEIDAVGYDAFFIKPITFEELKDTVGVLLSGGKLKQPETRLPTKSTPGEVTILQEDRKYFLPKARIVIIEIRANIAMLLKNCLENDKEKGLFTVAYFKSGSLFLKEIEKFQPEVILYDIIEIGNFSDFARELMDLAVPPKEIILFGEPKFKWEEVDSLIKEGMSYIPTPLNPPDKALGKYPDFELPAKDTVERLSGVIMEVCFKHGLLIKRS